ncbi:8-oxoguanine deaminase [bacterium]|nr:MAG: 8-oxoguanine deaminase [bacterium]
MNPIFLKNCYYIATFNDAGDELSNHDILIKGNVIDKIAPNIELAPEDAANAEIIDCSDYLIIPGMVNCHHHFYQTLTRNLPGAQDAKLFDWLKYLYPVWARLDPDAVYYSTLLATTELLKTGATCSSDQMYVYPEGFEGDIMEIQFEAASKTGIRFSPTRGSMTLGEKDGGLPPDSVVQTADEVVRDMERVIEKFHDPSPLAMRKIALAPCSPFSVDKTVMVETARVAREYNVILHTHLAETEDENRFCLEKYGKRPLMLMADWSWLGEDVYFAHGIWFSDEELELLQDSRTGICHCPTSNMRLGSGIARVRKMLDMGIRVGLGVDGSASNDTSDMLGEARQALLLQRVQYGSDALSARDVLRMATIGGAELLGFPKIGRIEPGYAADMAIFDMSGLQYAGAQSDPLAAIIFTGYNHGTVHTIVDGEIVVRDGKLTRLDEGGIAENANRIARKLARV